MIRRSVLAAGCVLAACCVARAADPPRLSILLLGDNGHHRPAVFAEMLTPPLAEAGIDVTYADDVTRLTAENLAGYSAVAIYRDSGDLPPENEQALFDYVEGGKGLVPIHCASHAFRNSARYTALVGGRFLSHETGVFRAHIVDAQHPALLDFTGFESWDETYLHNELADDRRVLMVREHERGMEPWTWVRDQGEGRVFYTAGGHDERSWKEPGFQRLLIGGIRWASGAVEQVGPALEFVEASDDLPNYLPGKDWGAQGDPVRRMQMPLSPADSSKCLHLPEGLAAELFAAEPDVVKPMTMSFDHRGRLWIVESVDYPNRLVRDPHRNGNDRIKICEDTDGDERGDKFTVFADRLNIPTGLIHANGGVIAVVTPHILFLKDTDGDDVADERKILYTGLGRGDTHAVASNLHYGLDNWIYGTVGYGGGEIEIGGKKQTFRQGIFRFMPDGSAFEFLAPTSNNTWGLGIGPAGDVFASTANGEHSVHLAIPNRYYEGVRGWHGIGAVGIQDHDRFHPVTENVRQVDFFGGFTAASGHDLYTARALPDRYWDRAAFVCEPTGHLVHINLLEPRGSGFVAHDGFNLVASRDAWFAPIAAQVGPDGAVWVLDWYNYIVQHNPTPHGKQTGRGNAYETTLRDKEHGRIYRIVTKDGRQLERLDLEGATTDQLIAALGHENLFWRLTAQRLLAESDDPEAVFRLAELLVTSPDEVVVAHALRVLRAVRGNVNYVSNSLFEQERRPIVRRAALACLPRFKGFSAVLEKVVSRDRDPLVRHDALLALAEMPASTTPAIDLADLIAGPIESPDPWLRDAAIAAAAPSAAEFLISISSTKPDDSARDQASAVVRVVAEHYARGDDPAGLGDVVRAIVTADPAIVEAIVAGLDAGWPEDRPPELNDDEVTILAELMGSLDLDGKLAVARLGRRWRAGDRFDAAIATLRAGLSDRLADAEAADEDRLAAARQLMALASDEDAVGQVFDAISPRTPPLVVVGLIEAAAESRSPAVAQAIVDRWEGLSVSARQAAATALLSRQDWTAALLDALESDLIAVNDLSLEQSQRLSRHPVASIAERAAAILAKGGSLPSPNRVAILEELLPLAARRGDAAKGRAVFEQNCGKCHRHGSLGTRIGPDLTGVAVRPKSEILTEILDPNRSVEGNFQQYTAVTTDGRITSGLLLSETRTAVELLDSEAKKHVLLREEIEEMAASKLSVMPVGFEKLGPEPIADLLEFLAARGRFLPIPLDKLATAVSTRGMFYDEAAGAERLVFSDWEPKTAFGVPFQLVDPQGDRAANVILLHGPQGKFPPQMPKTVTLPCGGPAKAIHLLSGVSGWGFPLGEKGSVSMIVRLHYADGETEDHELKNGVHFADYIREVDVPDSKLAFKLRDQQIRYLAVTPNRPDSIATIDLVKGNDQTAPVVMAVTIESP